MKSKRNLLIALLTVVTVFIISFLVWVKVTSGEYIKIGNAKLTYEVADDSHERGLGLSGRENLASGHSMLFIYDTESDYGIWMKDMSFSIDIIWLDANKKIVFIKENVAPETYPEVFRPDSPARYVIETNAGYVSNNGIEVGQTVEFNL